MIKRRDISGQHGFTIIELMIATTVLSVILLMVTFVMVGIGNLYYKGFNQARVQDNVRTVTDELAQKLQLSDGKSFFAASSINTQAYCIGTTRYSYALNQQIGSTTQHVLWRDTMKNTSCTVADNFLNTASPADGQTVADSGSELVTPRSRLTNFLITQANLASPYVITVGVAYGDDDLLCNLTAGDDCTKSTDNSDPAHRAALNGSHGPYDISCRGHVGQQFCAVGALQTTVVKRL